VAVATLGTVVLFGVGPGILLAIVLSILYRTWRSARPRDALLGRVPGTTVWWALKERPDAQTVPGVVAYRLDAPLYFANATRFRDRVREEVAAATPPPSLFVLDSSGIDDVDFTGDACCCRSSTSCTRAASTSPSPGRRATRRATRRRAGLHRHVADDHIFLTVDDAVRALGPKEGAAAPAGE